MPMLRMVSNKDTRYDHLSRVNKFLTDCINLFRAFLILTGAYIAILFVSSILLPDSYWVDVEGVYPNSYVMDKHHIVMEADVTFHNKKPIDLKWERQLFCNNIIEEAKTEYTYIGSNEYNVGGFIGNDGHQSWLFSIMLPNHHVMDEISAASCYIDVAVTVKLPFGVDRVIGHKSEYFTLTHND